MEKSPQHPESLGFIRVPHHYLLDSRAIYFILLLQQTHFGKLPEQLTFFFGE